MTLSDDERAALTLEMQEFGKYLRVEHDPSAHNKSMRSADFLEDLVARRLTCTGPFDGKAVALAFYQRVLGAEGAREQSLPKAYKDLEGKAESARKRLRAKLSSYYGPTGPGRARQWVMDLPDKPHSYEPRVYRRSTDLVGEVGTPDDDLTPFERTFHRYHLTLDREGSPIWLYTSISFARRGTKIAAEGALLVSADDNARHHMYDWEAEIFGGHLLIRAQRQHARTDVAVELFSFPAAHKTVLFGVRINDTWKVEPPTVANAPVILAHEPIGHDDQVCIGPVSTEHGTALQRLWDRHSGVQRLPPAGRTTARQPPEEPLLRAFWRAYLDSPDALTHIALGTPPFAVSGDQRTYMRHVDFSTRRTFEAHLENNIWMQLPRDLEQARLQVTKYFENLPAPAQVDRPYVPLGEAMCALSLTRWFTEKGVRVSTDWYKAETTSGRLQKQLGRDAQASNLIVLGSTRTNGLVKYYQDLRFSEEKGACKFRSDDHGVFEDNGLGERLGTPWVEDAHSVPVLITRRRGAYVGATVTVVSSTSGRVIERVGEALTDEQKFLAFLRKHKLIQIIRDGPLRFQLLLRVQRDRMDQFYGDTGLVDVWTG